LVHQAVRQAVLALGEDAPFFYTSQAAYASHPFPMLANKDAPAHFVIDVMPVLAEKIAAAMCHRTQHALFVRSHSQEAGRAFTVPEVIMREESLHRVLPQHDGAGVPHDPLVDLLLASGFTRVPQVE
jgi:hypothetical protein